MKKKIIYALIASLSSQIAFSDTDSEAFNMIMQKDFPLSSKEIQQYKNLNDSKNKVVEAPAGTAPRKSTSSIIPVSLRPGVVMPIIRVTNGMITSIVMTDTLGKVWPIASFSLGDPKSFNVQWNKKSGVLMVQPIKSYGQANIGVMLEGLDVPVMLSLLIGQKQWDYLDYIRVEGYQSESDVQHRQTQHAPDLLIQVLNGLPPQGAKEMQVKGAPGQVWLYQGKYLLLTEGTLISPQWKSKQSGTGPNGLNAYQLPATPSLLISINGALRQVTISDS